VGAQQSLITDRLRAAIGTATEPRTFVVTKQVAARLAEALGEDPEAVTAAATAPPFYIAAFETQMPADELPVELAAAVLAGDECELRRPLRWGERISGRGRVADIYERFGGRHGQTLYLRYAWTFEDERGDVVATAHRIMVRYAVVAEDEAP